MTDNELPGMWETSDFTGGADEIRPASGMELIRQADAAQYARPPIPEADRGRIRVRLLNALPDPYGSVAALCAQYSGRVVRNLSEVTDEERHAVIDDMLATVLNGPLEVAQFHWQIEGVTRSITHQMVRSRASFFAQESLRFAVAEDWANEVPLPPSLAGIDRWDEEQTTMASESASYKQFLIWRTAMLHAERAYDQLIELGMPAEEARGVLPHDLPTRLHWVMDLRTLLQEAGKRTCTQAQFPWRIMFGAMAQELRRYGREVAPWPQRWQFEDIANRLRPVCFQTGSCGFMAKFDRSCNIRSRVDAFAAAGVPSSEWGQEHSGNVILRTPAGGKPYVVGERLLPIHDYEWAADPAAARS